MTAESEAPADVGVAPFRFMLLRRLLVNGESGLAQISFRSEVLARYRGSDGFKIYRTDSAGKLQRRDGWSLDFGIVEGDSRIHTSLTNLGRIPEDERAHWLDHAVTLPLNEKFLKMQMGVHCADDGEIRAW